MNNQQRLSVKNLSCCTFFNSSSDLLFSACLPAILCRLSLVPVNVLPPHTWPNLKRSLTPQEPMKATMNWNAMLTSEASPFSEKSHLSLLFSPVDVRRNKGENFLSWEKSECKSASDLWGLTCTFYIFHSSTVEAAEASSTRSVSLNTYPRDTDSIVLCTLFIIFFMHSSLLRFITEERRV